MTEVWVGIILLATQIGGILLDKEFESHDKCWKHYTTHPRMVRVENNIPTTRPVMLFKIQSFGLGWITCERRYKFNGNRIDKIPPNVLLPTPEIRK